MSLPATPTPANPFSDAAPVGWASPQREAAFTAWFQDVARTHGLHTQSLRLASADASFRRYLRVDQGGSSCIIMDAPPDKENSAPFVQVATLMAEAGLRVPKVLAWEASLGFLLLSDLGHKTMMQVMAPDRPDNCLGLYLQAVDTLIDWQLASRPGVLPPYDEALMRRELELFPQWYLTEHRGVGIDSPKRHTLDDAFKVIIEQCLKWPSVYVHRDFMPRNLMVQDSALVPAAAGIAQPAQPAPLGVLDFQDAVYGPVTYDIASLMRDAFLSWGEDFVLDVTVRYWENARKAGLPVGDDFGDFYRGVEWMGLQRHLKVAGIFARLTLRDGKPQYLADAPRFIQYIRATAGRYRELTPLLRLVDQVEGTEAVSGFAFGRI